jgi:hypothetical protein
VFSGVTVISTEAGSVVSQDGNVSFQGTYSPTMIYSAAHDNLYLGDGNTLYWPNTEGYTLGACRAWFHVNLSGSTDVRQFVLNFGDGQGEASGIVDIEHGTLNMEHSVGAGWYTLDGSKLDGKPAKKGLYIHGGRKVVVP